MLVASFGAGTLFAKTADFRAVAKKDAQILQKGEAKDYCPICGMTLSLFYKTNHSAVIDGKTRQYCSIHCMLHEISGSKKKATDLKVIDNESLKFIDVKDAYYVVGSKQPGTMSSVSKYAFKTQEKADKFAKAYAGEVMRFDEVKKKVLASLKKEMQATKKRRAKAKKMGAKIYKSVCKKTDKRFASTALAKAFILKNNLCGKLRGKKLQVVGIYLTK